MILSDNRENRNLSQQLLDTYNENAIKNETLSWDAPSNISPVDLDWWISQVYKTKF